jgi:hypothetical protein
MLPDDELRELAEDIKANGLRHPIVLDEKGVLIDGRNRLAACNLAGVPPRFETLNGHDPVAYIISANVNRRHLTEGQRAIAVVRASDFSNLEKSGERGSVAAQTGVSRPRLSEAAAIVEHAPDLADEVMAGTKPFSVAYKEAVERREMTDAREREVRERAGKLECLRAVDRKLHLLVIEERLSLDDAHEVAVERKRAKGANERRAVDAPECSVAGS